MLRSTLAIVLALASTALCADLLLSACDNATEWSGGTVDATVKHDGQASLRWDHGASAQIKLLAPPRDFSKHRSVAFWMHSNVANGQKFILIIGSENTASTGIDYFAHDLVADFTGWKYIELKRSSFSTSREPLGWNQVNELYFTASGWGNTPNPANVIHIDQASLIGEMPTSDGLFAHLAPAHPRLIIPPGGFAAVRARVDADTTLARWMTSIRNSANRILTEAPSVYALPDGIRLLSVSRKVLDRVYTLAFTYRMTGDTAYLGRTYRELAAAAAFPNWNPSHFLDVAEMTHAFAIGYDWLYDAWTPAQRAVIGTAMVKFGINAYDSAFAANTWWLSSEYNWNTVCNGGIGMGALALADEDTSRYADLVLKTVTSMLDAGSIAMFGPDGAWPEGPGYWGYATHYLSAYTASLETALDTVFGITSIPGISLTGNFPVYMAGAKDVYFNYADAGTGTTRAPWLFWMAQRFSNPLYSWYQRRLASPHPLDIIWYDSTGRSPSQLRLPREAYFRNVEAATFRSSWDDPNMIYAGIKAGKNDVGHSHLDVGTFVIDALGERWAQDLGSDDYVLPGYFAANGWNSQRWDYYRLRTEGHNTLVINPSDSGGQDPFAETRIERFYTTETGDPFALLNLTDAYDENGATSVSRGIALVNKRTQVLMQDEVTVSRSSDLRWYLHTAAEATVAANGKRARLMRNGKVVFVSLLEPAGAAMTVMDAAPLPGSPNPTGQKTNGKKLSINVTGSGTMTFAVLFTPVTTGIDTNAIPIPAYRDLTDAQWPVSTPVGRVQPGARGMVPGSGTQVFTTANGHVRVASALQGAAELEVYSASGEVVFSGRAECPGTLERALNASLRNRPGCGVYVYRLAVGEHGGYRVVAGGLLAVR